MPASPASEGVSDSERSSEWSPYQSPLSSEEAHYHALQDMYSAARTRVVPRIHNNHLADTDSEDDSIYPATAEDNGDDNTNAFDPVDVGAGDVDVGGVGIGDVAVSNIPAAPTAAYVSQLETEIEALKGELALVNELRAEEMAATRRTRLRLYQYIGRVQGLAEGMIVRDM